MTTSPVRTACARSPAETVGRAVLHEHGVEAVISARAKRLKPASHDTEKYKWRHLVENFFQKLKEFKRIAMRAYKTDQRFAAMIQLATTIIRTTVIRTK
jgi:transposase